MKKKNVFEVCKYCPELRHHLWESTYMAGFLQVEHHFTIMHAHTSRRFVIGRADEDLFNTLPLSFPTFQLLEEIQNRFKYYDE